MNVKDWAISVINSHASSNTWQLFRVKFSTCIDTSTEAELVKLWRDLLTDFPPCDGSLDLEVYRNPYMWPRRKQWATAYFKNVFKLGHETTQRAESWNKQLNGFANIKTLKSLLQSRQFLVERQMGKELEMKDWHL